MTKDELEYNYSLCVNQLEFMRDIWLSKEWTIESEAKYQKLKLWVIRLEDMIINNFKEQSA